MKNTTIDNKFSAFTLAEVLITLGIIGIVAQMTIPTLMASTEKQTAVVSLKKIYSEFNQVITTLTNDYGCNGDFKCTGIFVGSTAADRVRVGQTFASYFKVIKACDASIEDTCFAKAIRSNFDGSGYDMVLNNNQWYYTFVTADGMSVGISSWGDNCSTNYGVNSSSPSSQMCAAVIVDVNGPKKPNRVGKDVFQFKLTNGHSAAFTPDGGTDDKYWSYVNGSNAGANACRATNPISNGCAAKIMDEGWQISYY